MRRRTRIPVALFAAAAIGCGGEPNSLLVSAASDLQEVSVPLAQRFQSETSVKVEFNFGSSGALAQQIEAGAKVDVFASANVAFVERLQKAGLIEDGTKRRYAKGRLVVWSPKSETKIASLDDLKQPRFRRIAMADPELAPYGAAAKQAMEASGLAQALREKTVVAENVRQAFQYASLGEVDAAFVSASLVADRAGSAFLVPEDLHRPLVQAAAVVKGSKRSESAKRFLDLLCDETGQATLKKFGFEAVESRRAMQ